MRSRDDILNQINTLCIAVDSRRKELWKVTHNPDESTRLSSLPDYIALPSEIKALESMIGVLHWVLGDER